MRASILRLMQTLGLNEIDERIDDLEAGSGGGSSGTFDVTLHAEVGVKTFSWTRSGDRVTLSWPYIFATLTDVRSLHASGVLPASLIPADGGSASAMFLSDIDGTKAVGNMIIDGDQNISFFPTPTDLTWAAGTIVIPAGSLTYIAQPT